MPQSLLEITLRTTVLIVCLIGLFGLVVPGFPGLTVIWLAVVGYAAAAGIRGWAWVILGGITLFMIAGNLVDNVLMGGKALQKGASWWALGAALVAGIAGSILLPPLGGIPAAFIVLFIVEWIRQKNWRSALSSVKGMAAGCGWAAVIRFCLGVVMIGLWAVWVFFLK
jgi:uncharacterized protein